MLNPLSNRQRRTAQQTAAASVLVVYVLQAVFLGGAGFGGVKSARAQEADTVAPIVSLTAPADGATVTGTVSLTADASDNVAVESVQFILDGSNLGAAITAAPYSYDFDSTAVSNGSHTIAVRAVDTAGIESATDQISVTVANTPPDNEAPAVSIVSPAANVTISGTTTISAEASDNVGVESVRIKVDSQVIGELLTLAPYTVTWDSKTVPNGTHTVSAVATDAAGHSSQSAPVSVQVQNIPDTIMPTVSITKPAGGSTNTGNVNIEGTAKDNISVDWVQFKINGVALGNRLLTPPYAAVWETDSLANGCYTISAQVSDSSGNVANSDDVNVVVNHNPPPPCDPSQGDCSQQSNVTNVAVGQFQNCTSASANTGHNEANNNRQGSISTGNATAGANLPSVVNTTNTQFIPGAGGNGNGDTRVGLDVNNTSTASLGNQVDNSATSGSNTINDNRFASTTTGAAGVFTDIVNTVNTNIIGSNFLNATDTIVDTLVGNINFLDLLLQFLTELRQRNGDTKVDLTVHNTSTGTIDNRVEINASTGGNMTDALTQGADQNRSANILTGDINVATNIVNLLNTNIIGSNWMFSTINVLGSFVGDIILPGDGVLENFSGDYFTNLRARNDSTAKVNNLVRVNGNTGDNTISINDPLDPGNTCSADPQRCKIRTGDTFLQTSILNAVNTNIIGANFFSFLPHIFGAWTQTAPGGAVNQGGNPWDEYHTGDVNGNIDVANVTDATIRNTITVNATTGENSALNRREGASIATGDINVATNLLNVANTNIIGSNWFFGHFNVFGNWTGKIIYAYPDLSVSNQYDLATVKPGDLLTYYIRYDNLGLAPSKGVALIDTLPSNVTYVSGSASNGGQLIDGQLVWILGQLNKNTNNRLVSFKVRVNPDLPVGTTYLQNSVNIGGLTPEVDRSNNTAGTNISVTVAPPPPPTPTPKPTPNPTPTPRPSFTIRKWNNAAGPVLPGDAIKYSIDVTNTGNVALQSILVNDRLPGKTTTLFAKSFPLNKLEVGQTMHINYQLTVSQGTAAGIYTNTAEARASYNGSALAAKLASSSVIVAELPKVQPASVPNTVVSKPSSSKTSTTTTVVKKPAPRLLYVTQKVSGKSKVPQGGVAKFIVTVFNRSKDVIKNVVVAAKLMNGSTHTVRWKVGTLKPNRGVKFSYTLNLLANAPVGKYKSSISASGTVQKTRKKTASTSVTSKFQVTKNKLAKGAIRTAKASGSLSYLGVVKYSGNKGLLFFNQSGKPISAYQFAKVNKYSLIDVLSVSSDPTDREFVRLYRSGLTLVGRRGKDGKLITASMVLNGLRKISRFKHIFG